MNFPSFGFFLTGCAREKASGRVSPIREKLGRYSQASGSKNFLINFVNNASLEVP